MPEAGQACPSVAFCRLLKLLCVLDHVKDFSPYLRSFPGHLQGRQTAASLQVKRSPRTRSATKKRDSLAEIAEGRR